MNRSPENGGEQQPPGAVYSYRDVRFHVCYNSEHTEWISTTSPHSRNRKARQLLARWPKIVLLPLTAAFVSMVRHGFGGDSDHGHNGHSAHTTKKHKAT